LTPRRAGAEWREELTTGRAPQNAFNPDATGETHPVTKIAGISLALSTRQLVLLTLTVLAAFAISLVPPPAGTSSQTMAALGLITMTVVLWATMVIPQPATSVLFVLLVLLTGTASAQAALSGFLSSSLWLVFGGLLIGTAAERTGFGRYIARRFLGGFRGSYSSLILGVLIGSTALAFLVPSNMGRLAITVPVVVALAKDSGYEVGTPGYIGLVFTVVIAGFSVAQGVLSGNLLNIMIVGAGETLYGLEFRYMHYLLLCGPVLGLAKMVLAWGVLCRLYGTEPPKQTLSEAEDTLTPEAKRVGIILTIAILLWATDSLHGIKPGWVALLAGILCVAPRVGVLPPVEFINVRRLLIMFWVGTVLSLAAVLTETGASRLITSVLSSVVGIEGQSPAGGYFAIAYLSSLVAVLSTFGGAVPTMAAMAGDVSAATGLPLETAVLSIAAGMSAIWFPYIAAPIVVGLMMGQVSQRIAVKCTIILAALTWVLIIPLNAAWWWLIGALG
jgi:di/tricarboxylate transporter